MSLWTVQTVPVTSLEFPLDKCLWWSHRGLRNMWGHKCKGEGAGVPVALSIRGWDEHNLSPLLGSRSKMWELEPLQTQTVFSVTLILLLWSDQRQKPDTELQTTSSPKMAWVSETYCPPFTTLQHQLTQQNVLPLLRKPYCTWSLKRRKCWAEHTSPGSQKRLIFEVSWQPSCQILRYAGHSQLQQQKRCYLPGHVLQSHLYQMETYKRKW